MNYNEEEETTLQAYMLTWNISVRIRDALLFQIVCNLIVSGLMHASVQGLYENKICQKRPMLGLQGCIINWLETWASNYISTQAQNNT